jgi:N-terminal helicase PWI domain
MHAKQDEDEDDEEAEDERRIDVRMAGADADAGEDQREDGLNVVLIRRDAYWLQRRISSAMAGLDPSQAQTLAEKVFQALQARLVAETNGMRLVLFGMQNRTSGPCLAAIAEEAFQRLRVCCWLSDWPIHVSVRLDSLSVRLVSLSFRSSGEPNGVLAIRSIYPLADQSVCLSGLAVLAHAFHLYLAGRFVTRGQLHFGSGFCSFVCTYNTVNSTASAALSLVLCCG